MCIRDSYYYCLFKSLVYYIFFSTTFVITFKVVTSFTTQNQHKHPRYYRHHLQVPISEFADPELPDPAGPEFADPELPDPAGLQPSATDLR